MIEGDSDFGDRVEPTFPTVSPTPLPQDPRFLIEFVYQGSPRSLEAVGTLQRDDMVSQITSAGVVEYEVFDV